MHLKPNSVKLSSNRKFNPKRKEECNGTCIVMLILNCNVNVLYFPQIIPHMVYIK